MLVYWSILFSFAFYFLMIFLKSCVNMIICFRFKYADVEELMKKSSDFSNIEEKNQEIYQLYHNNYVCMSMERSSYYYYQGGLIFYSGLDSENEQSRETKKKIRKKKREKMLRSYEKKVQG